MRLLRRMFKVRVFFGVSILLVLFCGQCFARSYDDVRQSGYLEIAVYRDFPPYSYLDGDEPAGIDIEVGRLLARELEVDVRWLWLTADENTEDDLRNAVWKGSMIDRRIADVMLRVPYDHDFSYAIDGYGMPRNDLVFMTAPYHAESWRIARNLEKTGEVRNLAIFMYEPIGVELDSLPDFYLSGALRGRLRDNVRHFHSIFQATDALKRGEISALAGMRSQIEWGLGEHRAAFDLDTDGLESMGKLSWDIGMAVKTDFRELGYKLNDIVSSLVASGEIERIFHRYRIGYAPAAFYSPDVVAQ